jgi:predicted DNA-binding protein YlxM (UPF0122 family)
MDDLARRALRYDFYGSLLTEKQRQYYDLYFQQDLSLGEISELQGISRTAVYDLLKRTDEALLQYEEKLGLVQKYLAGQAVIQELKQKLEALKEKTAVATGDHSGLNTEISDLWQQVGELLQKLEDSW